MELRTKNKNKLEDRTLGWQLSYWGQLLVLMFGQLLGCRSLRELTDITTAHRKKSFRLGFGKEAVVRNILSRCNANRDWHVFEEFSYHMIALAQEARIDREFCIGGKFYAFDSSTIDLCMSVYDWAKFRSTKSGIKLHVAELPLKYNTVIGMDGVGLSQGQKQRILIARAIYKSPRYIFLDEATNALDAKNERQIVENLNDFFKGRTVVVVAHRLSTVRHADIIIVLNQGRIAETGTHDELVKRKGAYYNLVSNQLELGL